MALLLPGALLAGLGSRCKRLHGSRRLLMVLFCTACLAGLAGLTGCGSGSKPLYTTTQALAGTYTFNVVATSGSSTASLPVTVTIQ